MAKQREKETFGSRLKTIGMAIKFTSQRDKLFVPLEAAAILLPFVIVTALVVFARFSLLWYISALFVALLAGMIVLNVRTSKVVNKEAVGKPGAAYALIDGIRGWQVTPGVAALSETQMVHRAVGKAGVVLLGEGGGKVRKLLGQEKKRISRVVGSTPVYTFMVGETPNDDFSVTEVRKRLMKLPKNIDSKAANHIAKRLDALGIGMAIPKGPIPTSANAGKGARRAMLRGR
ncbi:DUF4191 domain-containing protein [Glycomyces sp. TRM65418]|uniref:DUF4191 family protein n=1 Tax=Glycomyces sp. TRM65418 TaxID=2867006 RepID=UPI001CE5BFC8|nr:DUF4191 family protein [Glycomyces sp. TRM65418]MCC3761983.1 DUF4191 domain-containing protein [Glycomyces sp. TRM65418]QZD56058.1 DUF4191 domain-containing protein [Glycomyces sp. TRM65418]